MALLLCPGLGNRAALEFQTAAWRLGLPLGDLLEHSTAELVQMLPVGSRAVAEALAKWDGSRRIRAFKNRAQRLAGRVSRMRGTAHIPGDAEYPESLRDALGRETPACLTVLGPTALLQEPGAAIVGARDVSVRGRKLAEACARTFAEAGITVVSGGARGVDCAAHHAALAAGGTTVVVLPQGLFTYAVPSAIARGVARDRAAIVSQFLPDAPWETHAAVTRNATISALARLVCVIEPKKTGGSIRTARCALSQGKHVLVFAAKEDVRAQLLSHAGAAFLFDEEGQFCAQRLLDLWASAPASKAVQEDLLAASP